MKKNNELLDEEKADDNPMLVQLEGILDVLKGTEGGLTIRKHVDGRAVLVDFRRDDNCFGSIVLKGDDYKLFKQAGGFAGHQLEDESGFIGQKEASLEDAPEKFLNPKPQADHAENKPENEPAKYSAPMNPKRQAEQPEEEVIQ